MSRLVIALLEFATAVIPLLLAAAILWRLRRPLRRLAEAVTRALVLLVRLVLAGAAAVGCGLAAFLAVTGEDSTVLPVAAALASAITGIVATLWLTRDWRAKFGSLEPFDSAIAPHRSPVPQDTAAPSAPPREPPRRASGRDPEPEISARDSDSVPPPLRPPPLLDPALRQRLTATEEELARAARDDLGAPAAEWLTFWRRRVPDLISAAQDVYDDAGDKDKAVVAARLAEHLDNIIAEADRRLAIVRAIRHDLFTTRGNHAEDRIRSG